MRVRKDVPLGPLTTLRVGGHAARLAVIEREDEVPMAARDAAAQGEPLLILGRGSNVVVADEGFGGLVASMATKGIEVRRQGERVQIDVAAGEDWDGLVARAVDEGWTGLACMSGIPGLVGATPIQNVGAYGQEVSDTIVSVRVFDRDADQFLDMAPPACGFGYRASVFKRSQRWIVTRVSFSLSRSADSFVHYPELTRALSIEQGQAAPSRDVREAVLTLRRRKGMVLDPNDADSVSAGSFFVNPVVDGPTLAAIEKCAGERPPRFDAGPQRFKVPAAWLVERAGFAKGWRMGRAGLSRKHALAIVNDGGATAREIVNAARTIRDAVRARFGVSLEAEPVFVGGSWQESGL